MPINAGYLDAEKDGLGSCRSTIELHPRAATKALISRHYRKSRATAPENRTGMEYQPLGQIGTESPAKVPQPAGRLTPYAFLICSNV